MQKWLGPQSPQNAARQVPHQPYGSGRATAQTTQTGEAGRPASGPWPISGKFALAPDIVGFNPSRLPVSPPYVSIPHPSARALTTATTASFWAPAASIWALTLWIAVTSKEERPLAKFSSATAKAPNISTA